MSQVAQSQLQEFALFLTTQLQAGNTKMSPEEALAVFRAQSPSDEEIEDCVEALREPIAELQAGVPGKPHEQFQQEFRARHGLSQQ